MSTCISSRGEFSEHELGTDGEARFVCQACHVFDEEAALRRIAELEELTKPSPVETIEYAARQVLHELRAKISGSKADGPGVAAALKRDPLSAEASMSLFGVVYQQGGKVLHPDEVTVVFNPITGQPHGYIVDDTPR